MNSGLENHTLPRRNFFRIFGGLVSSLGIPGLWNASVHGSDACWQTDSSVDIVFLEQGLRALARAHQMNAMAGHLGAAHIAGYLISQQRPQLEPGVVRGIKADLQRVKDGQSVFGKKMSKRSELSDKELFAPFARQKPDEGLVDGIAESLERSIDQPRQSGHNVIFASLAIRALKHHPEFATPAVVDGIRKLMALFENESPGSGYYGQKKGRINGRKVNLPDDDQTPPYEDTEGMVVAVLDEVIRLKPEVHRIGYGGLVHIINHAAAIFDLGSYGYADLVTRAIRAHHRHLSLWRSLPNVADEKGKLPVSKFTPHTAEYWNSPNLPFDRALLTHRVKTMYGFDELAAAVDEEKREELAYDRLRYLM